MMLALATAVAAAPVAVTPGALGAEPGVAFDREWRYRPGDDPSWAAPDLDDSSWEALETAQLSRYRKPASGWPGIGWFRVRLDVDPALVDRPVALVLTHNGASEIYL